ncbi:MAG: hypothetical protein WDA27_01440 [Actinomycetota bacterium]
MRRLSEERGVAMITVVLASAVMSLAAATALTSASGSLRQSAQRRGWEQAVHLAESGASRALGLVAADNTYNTGIAAGQTMDRPWVLAAAVSAPLERAREGEFSWVVPASGGVGFGVGYVPTRAAPRSTRVVRVDFRIVRASGPRALLTQGALSLSGTSAVTGLGGSVHSNGDLIVGGNAVVERDATASASFQRNGNPTIGGVTGGGFPTVPVPAVSAVAFRSMTDYDLCPDATVRVTAAVACAGVVAGTGLARGWNGWRYAGARWIVTSDEVGDGGFYVYRSDVAISGNIGSVSNPWRATIVVEGLKAGSNLINGDLAISSNVVLRAWKQGVAIVAERDVRLTGGTTREVQGMILAGEQVDIPGSGTIIGSVVAAGTSSTLGSPVSANSVTGSVVIRAEFGAPSVQGGVTPLRWGEL